MVLQRPESKFLNPNVLENKRKPQDYVENIIHIPVLDMRVGLFWCYSTYN